MRAARTAPRGAEGYNTRGVRLAQKARLGADISEAARVRRQSSTKLPKSGGTQPPSPLPLPPRVRGYRTRITPPNTPCYACAAISWKPGRFLGTPDLVNKTPLHVLARLASGPPPSPAPSRPMVSETLVVSADVSASKS